MKKKIFILLDRDGTLNREKGYLSDPDEVELLDGVPEGLQMLRDAGCGLVLITNQSGIGRGYFDGERLEAIHKRLCDLLAEKDIQLDGIYVCPHLPEENCPCRKPGIQLVEQAAKDLDFDPAASFVIGDKPCDIHVGKAIGATTILVCTGYGSIHAEDATLKPDHIVADLKEAAALITRLLQTHAKR